MNVLDVRSAHEIESSGGGYLSCAVRLDPDFLDVPDTFNMWLMHFDCMRGCNICIIGKYAHVHMYVFCNLW